MTIDVELVLLSLTFVDEHIAIFVELHIERLESTGTDWSHLVFSSYGRSLDTNIKSTFRFFSDWLCSFSQFFGLTQLLEIDELVDLAQAG